MKKVVSALLVLSILMSSCGAAFADKLRLPAMLEIIGDSAFYGDRALDVVELPYGAKRIEPQAFAQSGVNLVILPETIDYIAPNAFHGTNVKVRTSQGSYAHSWALSNGFSLDSGMDQDEMDQELEYLSQNGLQEEDLYSEISEIIDTDGIDSEEILADIAELNALIEEGNALAEQSNALAVSLRQKTAELADCASSMSQVETSSYMKLTFDSVSLTIDRSIADQEDVSIRTMTTSEDGSLTTMTVSNGETWYMYEDNGNIFVSQNQPVQPRTSMIAQRGVVGDFIRRANEIIERINSLYGFVSGTIDTLLNNANREISAAQERISLCQVKMADYKKMTYGYPKDSPTYHQFMTEYYRYQNEMVHCRRQLPAIQNRAAMLSRTAKFFSRLNILSVGVSVGQMIAYWLDLDQIDAHGHPNSDDVTTENIRLANRMNYTIREMRTYLVGSFLFTLAQLLTDIVVLASVVPTAGTSAVPGIIINAIFMIIGHVTGTRMESTMAKINEYHQQLHDNPSVYGVVYDEKNHQPLPDVLVYVGDRPALTDAGGSYEIILDVPATYLVAADKDGYKEESETVTLGANEHRKLDFTLKKQNIIRTREDLINIVQDPSEDYILGNSIDLGGEPWVPNTLFTGSLDGDGYSIFGMQIDDSGNGNIGLFSGLDGAEISHLVLFANINVPITAQYENIGGLAGTIRNNSFINDCITNTKVTVTSGDGQLFIGGIGGYFSDSELRGCISNTDITVRSNNNVYAGGLIGNADGVCKAVDADANVCIDIRQSGYNSSASFYANGTFFFGENHVAQRCDSSGTIYVETNDGYGMASGCATTNRCVNETNVTVKTAGGSADAFGCVSGGQNTNRGTIYAYASAGTASAKGVSCSGSGAENYGFIKAEAASYGNARACGIWDETENRLSFDCTNSGEVTASSQNGTAEATGIYGCVQSVNQGKVSATSASYSCFARGMDSSGYGENTGSVYATGRNSSGNINASGVINSTACVNRGNVRAQNNGNGDSYCYAAGAQDGRYNVNRGSIEARCTGGNANANGTQCDDSQNYGNVMARGKNAFATGCGGHSGCLNEGPVSSFANGGSVVAHGVNGAGSVSTALISATQLESVNQSNYSRLSGTELYTSDSTQCQVTINGRTALSTGGRKTGFSYNYKTGAISTWDAITNWEHWVGLCAAESTTYGYAYTMPTVPPAPGR